jgi:Cft2 family RNA processing exonuclease
VLFTNLTRANEIGANSYLLDFGDDGRVVLDAGMHPREDGLDAIPDLSKVPVDSVDAIFLSHAHHDHSGALPVLSREQPNARIFMSEGTYYLADPLLHNSIEIMLKQRAEKSIVEYPLYGHKELDQQTRRWQACSLRRSWSIDGYPDSEGEPLTFTLHDAGHILGSVGVELNHRGRRILYTGDVNFVNQTLMQAAAFPREGLDTLIIETTRGANPTPPHYARDTEIDKLANAILETFDRGGAVLIPVFALGKTQEALAFLHFLQKQKRLPQCPIYIGGLGRTFSGIYDKLARSAPRAHPELQLLSGIQPQIMDGRLARESKPKRGHIYLISSGMMTEKTLSNLFAQNFLPQERYGIFFIGYCDPDSPAGRLKATPRGEKVIVNPLAGEQPVNCRVESYDFTAHSRREDLLRYILDVNPRVCVLIHGDPEALEWFQHELQNTRPEMKVVIPPPGLSLEI